MAMNSAYDPLFPISNRQDENILIEFNGIFLSEAEYIFYGLENSNYLEGLAFEKYYELKKLSSDEIYSEIWFYRPDDLLTYLNSGVKLDPELQSKIIIDAKQRYDFGNLTNLAMAEAMSKLIRESFVKSITFVLNNERKSDIRFIYDRLGDPELVANKCILLEVDYESDIVSAMKDEVKNQSSSINHYTTIITNEYQLILDICKNYEEYNASTMFYLLRNHSKNMEQLIKGDSLSLNELHTDEILEVINGDMESPDFNLKDHPVKSKFARFNPIPYRESKPSFMMFGEQSNE